MITFLWSNSYSFHMIKEQNEYKAVKWGFNATTNDFSKLHKFEGKDKFGGHTHTHTHTQLLSVYKVYRKSMKI